MLAQWGLWCGRKLEYPVKNPRVQAPYPISHTTTVDNGDRTRVTSVRSECIVHCASWTHNVECEMELQMDVGNTDPNYNSLLKIWV